LVESEEEQEETNDSEEPALTPWRHQKEGLRWLLRSEVNYKGALLGDEMGVGKTLQAILLALSQPKGKSTLVIVPATIIDSVWKKELSRLTTVISYYIHIIQNL
jgi:SNF2 family DNA or RNA helicase